MGEEEEYQYEVVGLSTVDVVKRESAKQSVILVFGVAGTILTYYIVAKMRDPDVFKYWKMRSALACKRWADRWSDRFTRLALHMSTVYNGEKL